MSSQEVTEAPAAPERNPDARGTDEAPRPLLRRLPFADARYSGLYLWAIFILIFAIWVPDTFLTWTTVKSILSDQSITIILACGLLFTLASGSFDLSIAQNLGVTVIVVAKLLATSQIAPVWAVLIGLAIGAAIGVLNGGLVAFVGVDSFIATLGVSSVLLAFTELVSDGLFVGPVPGSFQSIAQGELLGLPKVTLYALIVALLSWWVLEHTPLGRRIFATGSGRETARLAGVSTRGYVFGTFVVTGAFGGLAAILLVSKVGSVSPDIGPPYLLPTFAACFLGSTQLKLGRFNVWGTVLALLLLATGVKGLQLAGSDLWITNMFNGVALVGAVSVAVIVQRRRNSRLKADAGQAAHNE